MKVVAVMTRAPEAADRAASPSGVLLGGPKTRLTPLLPDPTHRETLQRAFLADVLTAARGVDGAAVRIAVTPGARPEAFAGLGVAPAHVIEQRGDDLGTRERGVFADLFRRGARQVVLVGSDLPLLTAEVLQEAFAALSANPAQVVLGPSPDGGYYLLGLAAPKVPDLFTGVRWSTKYTLMDTLRRCEFEERRVTLLPLLPDVDEPADVAHLVDAMAACPGRAPHTAAALTALGLRR